MEDRECVCTERLGTTSVQFFWLASSREYPRVGPDAGLLPSNRVALFQISTSPATLISLSAPVYLRHLLTLRQAKYSRWTSLYLLSLRTFVGNSALPAAVGRRDLEDGRWGTPDRDASCGLGRTNQCSTRVAQKSF